MITSPTPKSPCRPPTSTPVNNSAANSLIARPADAPSGFGRLRVDELGHLLPPTVGLLEANQRTLPGVTVRSEADGPEQTTGLVVLERVDGVRERLGGELALHSTEHLHQRLGTGERPDEVGR